MAYLIRFFPYKSSRVVKSNQTLTHAGDDKLIFQTRTDRFPDGAMEFFVHDNLLKQVLPSSFQLKSRSEVMVLEVTTACILATYEPRRNGHRDASQELAYIQIQVQ